MARKLPDHQCQGTSKKGEQCKAPAMRDADYCNAHNTLLPEEARFGSPSQASAASTGVVRRYPRLREIVERKIEESAERIVEAQIEALDATRLSVNEETGEVHVHPDFWTRAKVGDMLVTRALGRPGSEQTINVDARSIHFGVELTEAQLGKVHELLRDRPAITATTGD